MRWLTTIRILFFVIFTVIVFEIIIRLGYSLPIGIIGGLITAAALLGLEYFIVRKRSRDVLALFAGITVALVTANLLAFFVTKIDILASVKPYVYIFFNILILYLFGSFAYHKKDELKFLDVFYHKKGYSKGRVPPKIVDTSVIIDGRILGIAKTGFLEGEIIVPKFVLRELQRIADAKDHAKRTKGRRGLDVLKELQQLPDFNLVISSEDVPRVKEVDHKLIELARRKKAKILTIDYNLKKLADIEGVRVLNINELSKELKPILVPGDIIRVKVLKQGKEEDQGIGYLEDGTMVVVENGADYIGEELECAVISMLQTDAGRMIFAKPKNVVQRRHNEHHHPNNHR